MNWMRIVGVILLVVGILVLVYGGFNYTKKTHDVDLGSLQFSVKEQERMNIPVWTGVVATLAGAALLALGKSRRT